MAEDLWCALEDQEDVFVEPQAGKKKKNVRAKGKKIMRKKKRRAQRMARTRTKECPSKKMPRSFWLPLRRVRVRLDCSDYPADT